MTKQCLVVLGAGITGLSLAWQLKKQHSSADIVVLEKSQRAGGWIETRNIDGFLFEMGPRSCRAKGKGAYTLRLIEELGMQDEVILADPASKIRYVYENRKLQALPHSFGTLLTSPFLPLFLKAAWRDWRSQPQHRSDESVFDFAERHFGKGMAERFVDPLTFGIYAANCRDLSVGSCFPQWVEWERSHGSLIKAAFAKKKPLFEMSPWVKKMQKASIFTLKDGMESLVHVLVKRLGGSVRINTSAEALKFKENGIEVILSNGESLFASHVYSTLPQPALSKIVNGPLVEVPQSSVAVVGLGFNRQVLNKKGFGYLVPSREKEDILGMVWDSSAFPQQNAHPDQTRLTIMIDASKPKDFKGIALETLRRHLGIGALPEVIDIKEAANAIPKYVVGHREKMDLFRAEVSKRSPHLTLLGTQFQGVAVNDCVAGTL